MTEEYVNGLRGLEIALRGCESEETSQEMRQTSSLFSFQANSNPPSKPSTEQTMVSTLPSLTAAEQTIVVCSDIVSSLLDAHSKGQTINLNALKTTIAKKHGSKVVPRLVDIISAVPQESRDLLLPVLRAKPVRTASGVSASILSHLVGEKGDREQEGEEMETSQRETDFLLVSSPRTFQKRYRSQ